MPSVASGGKADRMIARILLSVVRAGLGTPARYLSTSAEPEDLDAALERVALVCFFMERRPMTTAILASRRADHDRNATSAGVLLGEFGGALRGFRFAGEQRREALRGGASDYLQRSAAIHRLEKPEIGAAAFRQ